MSKRIFQPESVRRLRQARGMLQDELARLVGCSAQNVSAIETGRANRSEYLPAIAKALGCSVDDFYSERNATLGEVLSDQERSVIEAMRRMDDMARAKVWAFTLGLEAGGTVQGGEAAGNLKQAVLRTQQSPARKPRERR